MNQVIDTPNRTSQRKELFPILTSAWVVGYALWWCFLFSNGINGPSWFPVLKEHFEVVHLGRFITYFLFAVLMVVAFCLRKRVAPLSERSTSIGLFSIISSVGFTVIALTGFEVAPLWLFWIGALLVGIGSAIPVLAYWEMLMLAGAEKACKSMCASLILGALLYFGVAAIGSTIPVAASVFAAICPLASFLLQLKSWRDTPKRVNAHEIEVGQLKIPPMLPIALFVYGIAFGIVFAMNSRIEVPTYLELITNAVFIAILSLIIMVNVLYSKSFRIDKIYRLVLPLLGTGFILFPLIGAGSSILSSGIVLAGYACSRIFAATVFSDITSRRPAPMLGTAAVASIADAGGIALGSLLGWFLLTVTGMEATILQNTALIITGILTLTTIFLLTESGVSSLWGALKANDNKQETSPDKEKLLTMRIDEVASEFGLTPREKEVFFSLVQGKSSSEIAKEFFLSESTVLTHIKRIYSKLDVHSRIELVNIVYMSL